MREVSHGGRTRPRDDGDEQNACDDGALDAVQHQHHGQDTSAKDADPHGRVAHLVSIRAYACLIEVLLLAAGQLEWRGLGAGDEPDAGRVGQADNGQIETDSNAGSELDAGGNGTRIDLARFFWGYGCWAQGAGRRVRTERDHFYAKTEIYWEG